MLWRFVSVTSTAVLLTLAAGCREGAALPALFAVPAASLTTDGGNVLQLDELQGKVVIYDFIFTQCAATCPAMTASMQRLARELDSPDVRFVSISVDPGRDTPEVLRKYADRVRTDQRWIFLTGERQQVVDLSIQGFKLAAENPARGAEAILHSTKFVVADRKGQIRGYYDGTSAEDVERLARDVRTLLREA